MSRTYKKSKKNKTMLAVSSGLAVAIVAGSTFAWFTSKDEVTNRLSASANYGVSIAEDFQPPENWLPGQEINKDVSAVNTGNVDAFVRMWLEGEMSIFNRDGGAAVPSDNSTGDGYLKAVTDPKYTSLGFNYCDNSGTYFKELSTVQRKNPDLNDTSNDEETNHPATFSEVQAAQSGGILVYAPTNAAYSWTLEQSETMTVYSGTAASVEALPKGTVVGSATSVADKKVSGTGENYYGSVDASTFKPASEGLYLFRRNVKLANGVDTYEYSGYYFIPASSAGNIGGDTSVDHYLALYTDTTGSSDYTLPSDAVTVDATTVPGENTVLPVNPTGVKFYTAKETVVNNSGLTWDYDATAKTLTAKYEGTDAASTDDISVVITLANIGSDPQEWTALGETGTLKTFYYNDDLEEGDTTTKLVDSVKLANDITQFAFLAFDFDLNVFMDSIQVTMNDAGVEQATAVTTWDAITDANTEGHGAATNSDSGEISSISWT